MKFATRLADDVCEDPKLQIVWGIVKTITFTIIGVGHWYYSGRPVAMFFMMPLASIGIYMICCGVTTIRSERSNDKV